jgi:hypothetical protein
MRVLLTIALLLSLSASAQESKPASKKNPKANTQLFEQEGDTHVTGKVKVVREIQEETEIFLDNAKGSSGPFVLPVNVKNRAGLLKILLKSQKTGGPSVTLDVDDQQRIKSVEESAASSSSKPNWEL